MLALRLIPNRTATIAPEPLSEEEQFDYPIGAPFPLHTEGMLVKQHRQKSVFIIQNGKRHHIPDYDTFLALKLNANEIVTLSQQDFDQIVVGDPLPSLSV